MNNIKLYPISRENFKKIAPILNNDEEKQFVSFNCYKDTNGIFLDNTLIGLFSLIPFIDNTLTIHVALLKDYRNNGIGGEVFKQIVEQYGNMYPDIEYFIANIDEKNIRAIKSIEKIGLKRTDEYDEIMTNEGSEFFLIYKLKNPYYQRKVKEYDKK